MSRDAGLLLGWYEMAATKPSMPIPTASLAMHSLQMLVLWLENVLEQRLFKAGSLGIALSEQTPRF